MFHPQIQHAVQLWLALVVEAEHHGDLLARCYVPLQPGKAQPGSEGSSCFLPQHYSYFPSLALSTP